VRQSWGEPLRQRDLDLFEKFMSNPNRTINLKDIPEVTENTFENKSGIHSTGLFRPHKQQITLRIDSDVIAWAKRDGEGYQTRINEVLRKAMLAEIERAGAKSC